MPPPSLTHETLPPLSSYQPSMPSVCSQPNQAAISSVLPRSTTSGLFYNTPLPYPPSSQLLNQVLLTTTSGPPPQLLQGSPPQFHGGQRFTSNPVHRPPFPVQLAPTFQATPVPNSNLFGLATAQQVARPAHTVGGRTPAQFIDQFPRVRAMLNNVSGPNWPIVSGPPSKLGRY